MAHIPGIDTEFLALDLGGNTFGWTSDRDESFAVLDAFLDGGGALVDTADGYSAWVPGNSGGESETIIGEWFARSGTRDRTLISTKVATHPDFKGLSPANIAAAADASLARLRTDRIDLYYAHFDDETQPIEDIATAFDALVAAGKIRAIGISNLSVARANAWIDFARSEGLAIPVALQPQYSLVHRADVEPGYAELAEREGLAVFPYSSLGSGLLTGKYRTKDDIEGAARQGNLSRYVELGGLKVVDVLVDVASSRGAAPATVALAWLLSHGVTAPIASARTTEQLPELLAAPSLTLTADEVAALDKASQPFT